MTIVLNDPTSWPTINANRFYSYFVVATFVGLTYDWALTFGQEVELVWVRYLGIFSAVVNMLYNVPTISQTDTMLGLVRRMGLDGFCGVCNAMGKILSFLIVIFLAVNIFSGIVGVMATIHNSGGGNLVLNSVSWIISIMFEILTLFLAVWIAVKHFRELRQHSTGGIIGDCFMVLMKTHMLYFASFLAVSCFEIFIDFSPTPSTDPNSLETLSFYGLLQILEVVQTFVLGPRLILGIREYNAKLVADSDAATAMTSIAFQERVHISTGSDV
ncbi:uncharacterized protein EDB93DRAFT_1105800 [Suillus bovinus]|uniref:uncharacterized protein n=1 Tax=Suillus bovinus TaxID=48563 RepID=UPI001B86A58C|nr:uncharacterized protein EDB93DRAFT_1105800 [Suillus bovinus]KAG2141204.1 hypothetical protein EDB93DRAFT_1105800 [Suillus bovinus]